MSQESDQYKTVAQLKFHVENEWEVAPELSEQIQDFEVIYNQTTGEWLLIEEKEED